MFYGIQPGYVDDKVDMILLLVEHLHGREETIL